MSNVIDVELKMLREISERVGNVECFELSSIEIDFLYINKNGDAWLRQCPTNSSLYMFTRLAKKHIDVN